MSELRLRPVRASDFDAVYRIYMSEGVIDYLGYDPMDAAAFLPVFDELQHAQTFHVAVLGADDAAPVIGFCRLTRYPGRAAHRAYLSTLAIDPAHAGQGHGQALIHTLVSALQSDGVRRLELMMEADNPRAQRFYEQLGFVQEGRLDGAYKRSHQDHWVDEVLWVRHLGEVAPQRD